MMDFNDAPPQIAAVGSEDYDRRIERLREALRHNAKRFADELFPLHTVSGGWARIGNVKGERGESLALAITGPDTGAWIDHATGEKGDAISLWMAVQHYGHGEFMKAVADLEQWCGISAAPVWASAVARRVEERKQEAQKAPPAAHRERLPPPSFIWQYLAADGATVLGTVYRHELEGGGKTFRQQNGNGEWKAPDPRPLYRIPNIATAEVVVLVEGEKCADALASIGVEATTAMGGANAQPAKTDWSPLAGKTVINWPDNDEPGLARLEKVRPYLEAIGCKVIDYRPPIGKPKGWDAADAVEEGFDVGAALAKAIRPDGSARRRLRILDMAEICVIEPVNWLVKDIAPSDSFIGLYGLPGSTKSFVALDLALSIATGRKWLGQHEVKPGRVLYVNGEGQRGIRKRVRGWVQEYGTTDQFHLVPQAVAMPDPAQLDELIALISELPSKPALIVLDTLARTFGGGDENSQKDMNAFVSAVDRLKEETGASVLVVHHSGKDDSRGARGSSAFTGAVDTLIHCTREGDKVRLANRAPFGKQKDAEEFEDIALRKVVVRLAGLEGEDDPTTLIMARDDEADDEPPKPAGARGPLQEKLLSVIMRAGRPMGLASLVGATGSNKGSVFKALEKMADSGIIREAESGGNQLWEWVE